MIKNKKYFDELLKEFNAIDDVNARFDGGYLFIEIFTQKKLNYNYYSKTPTHYLYKVQFLVVKNSGLENAKKLLAELKTLLN